jgi:radical SAM protein with 4Fe4S-binding SPASM domain
LEQSMPVRVRWDVDFRGRAGRTKRIARQIREASPKVVELRIEGEKGFAEFPAIFAEIHKCSPWIEATVRLFPGASALAQRGYSMKFVWEVDARRPFEGMLPPDAEAISFTADESSLGGLPDVLEEFAGSGARVLHLPNVNAIRSLAEVGHVPVPRIEQLQAAVESISRLSVSLKGKSLVVHDYFLWKLFRDVFPKETGKRIGFLGCHAASALAYVDWDGNVYPCDSLPIRLGNLQETTLQKIWRAPARIQILDALRAAPADCGGCGQIEGCHSGCRGLAYAVSGSLSAKDPYCRESPAAGAKRKFEL